MSRFTDNFSESFSWFKMPCQNINDDKLSTDFSSEIENLSLGQNTRQRASSPLVDTTEKNDDTTSNSDGKQEAKEFRSNVYISLCSKDELNKRMNTIQSEKGQIQPMQLSTVATAEELRKLKTDDLIKSFVEVLRIRNPQVRYVRETSPAYYNWVLVDLSRRMKLIDHRFQKKYGEDCEIELRKQVIDPVAEKVGWSIHKSCSFGRTKDKEYFDYFTPFVAKKRERILRIVDILGDEICLFTEFIDMKNIGDMKSEEYFAFYHDLLLCKNRLKMSLSALDESSTFCGDPTMPYNKVEVLNHEA
ncbi:hypothetical protein BDC45DRAFT_497347 [Circinella umbellata]|nr:hypothetical protein BDC45DRAFT_497347 [Circinella umbellata]